MEISLDLHYKMPHMGSQKLANMVGNQIWHPNLSYVPQSCQFYKRVKVVYIVQPPVSKIILQSLFEFVPVDFCWTSVLC